MEAKDTVLTQDKFEEWCGEHQIKGCGKKKDMCEVVCRPLAQAEISFKAGYEWAREEMNLQATSLSDMLAKQRQAGRRDVVEWIEGNRLGDLIPIKFWQDKIKEWGIE